MDIFSMGEYGSYVWSSYLLTLIVVVASLGQARRRHRRIQDEIMRLLKIEETGE